MLGVIWNTVHARQGCAYKVKSITSAMSMAHNAVYPIHTSIRWGALPGCSDDYASQTAAAVGTADIFEHSHASAPSDYDTSPHPWRRLTGPIPEGGGSGSGKCLELMQGSCRNKISEGAGERQFYGMTARRLRRNRHASAGSGPAAPGQC